ncbi:MAG: response regulator transcription factor [Bdellovibrionales bacterium]
MKFLILEDDKTSQLIIASALKDYDLDICSTLAEARAYIDKNRYDFYFLDMNLPDGSSTELLIEELSQTDGVIFFVSSCKQVHSQLFCYQLGAVEFIEKPFHPMILKAKVEARISSKKNSSLVAGSSAIEVGDLYIDDKMKQLSCRTSQDSLPKLTKTEFEILQYLCRNVGTVFSREQIMSATLGDNSNSTNRTIDAHISNIRRKLGLFQKTIVSVHGFGYKIDSDSFSDLAAVS